MQQSGNYVIIPIIFFCGIKCKSMQLNTWVIMICCVKFVEKQNKYIFWNNCFLNKFGINDTKKLQICQIKNYDKTFTNEKLSITKDYYRQKLK